LTTNVAYEKAFYVYTATCSWWCLETAIISYIICQEYDPKTTSSWIEDKIKMEDLLTIVDDYFTNNKCILLIHATWEKEVNISKKKWKSYIQTEFKNKTGKDIVESLMQSWETWDLYSLSLIYLSFLQDLCETCLKEYQDFLVGYILAFPFSNERITTKAYYSKITEFSEKYTNLTTLLVDRNDYKEKSKVNQLHVSEIESVIY
jgi:hypothetical protein